MSRVHTIRGLGLALAALITAPAPLLAVNGEIVQQQVAGGKGYTVLRVWGSHYDMGYAHAWFMHAETAAMISQTKIELGAGNYSLARSYVSTSMAWKPDEIEDELDGMVAALAVRQPAAAIDKIDLKVVNVVFSDLAYGSIACRSHSCWGNLVADPIKTISTRRLDFSTPITAANHHVLCVWLPTDGSPAWANLSWAGAVAVVTAVNEFGTISSLHDYGSSSGTPYTPCLPRSVAARHMLTAVTDPNLDGHADSVFTMLQSFDAGTGSFINYYVPEGHGAVITCRRTPRPTFHKLRKPQPSYFSGDVLITTNSETDGTYTPSGGEFMADYYQDLEDANTTATLQGHWDIMGSSGLHKMSIAYRARRDMTVWAQGRLDPGTTPRVELEWADLDSRGTLTLDVVNETWGTVETEPNQPIYEPNQTVVLTAAPIDGKYFRQWTIFDPNYPGDANYAAIDTNLALTLAMTTDQHVEAAFKCGSGLPLALTTLGAAVLGLMRIRRRARMPAMAPPT
ncbi:MAG: hypothetical protein JXQ73_13230 [Phycisphaerae bacterium]|nr:hypothetical protein [Phycisphaerae bacterium]